VEEKLLTPDELAKVLSVSLSWVYERSRPGNPQLPVIKLGKYSRFSLPQVLRCLGIQDDQEDRQ